MRAPSLVRFLVPAALFAAACGSGSPADQMDPSGMQPAVPRDYHQDAKAVLDHYCTNCHQAGGIAPFELTDYASAKNHAPSIQAAVASGKMPPWLPADDSMDFRYSRKMPAADKQILLDWVQGGAAEGDGSASSRITYPPVELPAPPRPDLTLTMPTPYTPNQQLSDDYRCFVIDPGPGGSGGLAADSFMQAATVKPGAPGIVHHVIVFEIPAKNAADVRAKDANEAGPGYTCFGGAGTNGAQMVTGWAPGGTVTRLQPDEGILVHKGSIFVMQVHYNLLNFSGQSDVSAATFELAATPPANQVFLLPLANPNALKIPAGAADASQVVPAPVSYIQQALKLPTPDVTIVSVAPHMHVLGTRISVSLDSQPMIDIPAWDFHWQQGYYFQQPVIAHPNQMLFLECHYDNSAAHQPVVGGKPQEPRDVSWGEGTLDEMCLSFLGIRFPRTMP